MSPMSQAMKMILPLITLIIIIGVALFISYKMGYGNFLGKLPFDIHYRSASTTIFIPLGTCVGLSLLYSLLKWFFARF